MPSRPVPAVLPAAIPPPEHHHGHHHYHSVLIRVLAGTLAFAVVSVVFLVVFFIYRKLSYNRTAPFENNQSQNGVVSNQHQRFSYSLLRRATGSFSAANLLGHGGFGSVYKATLPSGESLAVKLMDSQGSIQGEREFQNELSLALNLCSPHILSLLGYSMDNRGKRMLLVYELMPNRSLQEALFDRKCSELMDWKKRFRIALDIALGLEYLHHSYNPPVIHGDVKPSNVLLDSDFNAKIGDFGLARLKTEDQDQNHLVVEEEGEAEDFAEQKKNKNKEDNGSIVEEETESVSVSVSILTGGFEEGNSALGRSPESFGGVARVSENPEASSPMDESGKNLTGNNGKRKGGSGRDWWWKQENCGESESGRVKDYVMEWIGNEISKERPKTEWSELEKLESSNAEKKKKKRRKRLEWWASMDEKKDHHKHRKKPREWWKEEFCEELTKKKKKKKAKDSSIRGDSWWQKDRDEDEFQERKKRKSKSSSTRRSIDWWLDGISGELRSGRRNSQDWASCDIPKSGNISSTPSMRGTVCYVAPEYGGGGQLSEKCDVYSFGVLILVLVSGRRPLQVTASPMSEFERANLTSWARQLARNDRLLDLVDPALHSLDKEEALLCLTIALLCLQRTPSKRPSMKEIVGMLSGEAEPPHLPFEFSPSPPSNFPFKSRKKAR
ncbi:Receptor-like serine/threonine-protein kinase [Morus notabilis]|uniref:non-specific serine/threonine protein kinase n=1 Tax=Morus notabilis TaxID=981085 RepID=W9QRZ8_9ROSA|nr:receptor-like serine/threonine-protein kinase At2g45590 [Morus notabilis]EXB52075.1 Receptor-like serine/threonine-protein kinase [Morus notabilis]